MYEAHFGPNMTPMVDVVMVILVFFMASSAILGPEWFVRAALPVAAPARADPAAPDRSVRVRIAVLRGEGGAVLLAASYWSRPPNLPDLPEPPAPGGPEALGAFLAALAARADLSELAAVIEPGPGVPYEAVVAAHDAAARAGVRKTGLLAPAQGG
jgi:biopolymer transport protein ExbD